MRYASASRWFIACSVLIGLAQIGCVIAFSWLITQAIVDVFIGGRALSDVTDHLLWAGVVIAVRSVLAWVADVVATRAATAVKQELRSRLLRAVAALGPAWSQRHPAADIATTATRGLDALDAYFAKYVPQLVLTAIAIPIFLAVLLWQDWITALTVAITMPLIPIFMVLIGFFTQDVQKRQWTALRTLSTHFSDVVEGLSTLKLFGRARHQIGVIAQVTEEYRMRTMKVLRVSFMSGFVLELAATLSVAIVAVTIGTRLISGELTLWVGLFVLLITPEAYLPLRNVGANYHAAAEGIAAADDVFAILDEARQVTPVPAATVPSAHGGGLTVRHLGVHYPDATAAALEDFSLSVAPGELVAMMGPSGVGKSTVFAALLGFVTANTPIAQPERIAWMGQRPALLAGTVADNVALGAGTPDTALVSDCLEYAALTGVVAPELELGADGAGISGGQAQRVALARALYRLIAHELPVLLLDEPTSALDDETEARVAGALRQLVAQRAVAAVVITHRPRLAALADRVVRLDKAVSHA